MQSKSESQLTLFEPQTSDVKNILLYALGEFQARGKILAERELPLDRLRGAFRRASEKFQSEELSDEKVADELESLGVRVVRKPSFVAKHPYRVTVSAELAEKACSIFKEVSKDE